MTESCPHQRKIFHSPLANHFSPVMQSSQSHDFIAAKLTQGRALCQVEIGI
jgi:hypothetical protein